MDDYQTQEAKLTEEGMLREFHESLDVHGGWMPSEPTTDLPPGLPDLRMALLDEEVQELRDAVEAGDIEKIADAIGDIKYVATGTAVAYGIPDREVFEEVHRSNMTKTNDPGKGKLAKGPDYEPPDINRVLDSHRAPHREERGTGRTTETTIARSKADVEREAE